MQVYAIVYCPRANEVLVCKKKRRGYFFKRSLINDGNGISLIKNGGGKYCFPGGRKDNGESFRVGAVREFREETGVNLDSFTKKERFLTKKGQYECVVFLLSVADFFTIQNTVSRNLNTKRNFHLLKRNQKNSFLRTSPIEDDELESVERKTVQDCMGGSIFIQNDNATGWFYEMCEKLMAGNHGGRKRRYSFPL